MRVLVVGVGASGARLARQLLSTESVDRVVLQDVNADRLRTVAQSLGEGARVETTTESQAVDVDVVLLAADAGQQLAPARVALSRNQHVISLSDDLAEVQALLDLDAEARERDVAIVVGSGFAPGLTCVLAAHAASRFDRVDEIHVAKVGTGGPACARQHHSGLGRMAMDWRDGGWVQRPPMSGRELCWFPDPVGAQDCYRAALADALVLVPAFPGVRRVTSRVAATRRDRLTARLPMLWPSHPEGGPGAIRVEVRGDRGDARDVVVLGAMDRPAVAAGAVAAVAAIWAHQGRLRRAGAAGLAEMVEPVPFLSELATRGVRAAIFEGEAPANASGPTPG